MGRVKFWPVGIFWPRAAKKLAMLSMELPVAAGRPMGREPGAMRVVENLPAAAREVARPEAV